ncbi:hypothetical protein [Acuticoccus mangrovi]|uniref:Uncharacterized protein n=1 Tax=Acuticoccus mangrovi TaxID=2796142 RepID=A0A934ISB7_9HYPH|nr:hypothetical protein [Acuticoccus mangrovi]MBJ3777876.1 hypothetical protein [Acuticoccus mangrovi]
MRRRDLRERQALKLLISRREVSAIELGNAAVAGEVSRFEGREKLGLKLGMHFMKRGFARLTRENKFVWTPPAK